MHTSLTQWLAAASLSQCRGKREIVDDVFGRNCTYKSREKKILEARGLFLYLHVVLVPWHLLKSLGKQIKRERDHHLRFPFKQIRGMRLDRILRHP